MCDTLPSAGCPHHDLREVAAPRRRALVARGAMWPDEATTPVFRGCVFANARARLRVARASRQQAPPRARARGTPPRPRPARSGAGRPRATRAARGRHARRRPGPRGAARSRRRRARSREPSSCVARTSAALGGARGVDDRKPRPPPRPLGPSSAARSPPRARFPDHPNWALVPSRRARAFDDRDRSATGAPPARRGRRGAVAVRLRRRRVFPQRAPRRATPRARNVRAPRGGDERQRRTSPEVEEG